MSRDMGDPIFKEYALGDAELEAAAKALAVLAGALHSGAELTVSAKLDGQLVSAKIPHSVQPAIVDLVSLLVSKRQALTMVMDRFAEVTRTEAGRLLGMHEAEIAYCIAAGVFTGRKLGKAVYIPISEVLALKGGHWDAKAKVWVMPAKADE